MIEEMAELVKNSLVDDSDYVGLQRAFIKEEGTVFTGYALELKYSSELLFISDIENPRLFHGGFSVFGASEIENRCLWVLESHITPI